jgi:hypothetical protein
MMLAAVIASDVPAGGLHQICVFGYTDERFRFLNTYGDEWENRGVGTLAWSFLTNPVEPEDAYTPYGFPGIC